MIRVLHVIDSLDLGGAQTALLNLLRYADGSRFHHEVAAMHGRGVFAEAFEALRVRVHSLSRRRFPPEYLRALPRLLRAGEPFDIVHCHLFGSNWIAKPLAAACGVRRLYNHDQCNDAFRTDSPAVITVDALLNRLSTRVLAVSRSIEEFLRTVEAVPEERIRYLPNAVDLAEFHPATEAERRAAREKFGLPAEGFVIGGVGRLTHQKHFDLLLDAVRPLLAADAALCVALFGSGPDEGMLRERARGLEGRVIFAGATPDRAAIYHCLDLLAMSSRYEGLPMTLLEAMASGVPVVASAVDGVREIAEHGAHAWLMPPGDVAGFSHAIARLRTEPPLREQLAARALDLVREDYDAKKMAAKLEALYLADMNLAGR